MNASPSQSKVLFAAAMLGCSMSAALAEDTMTGKMTPFDSVQFAPDQDVACLAASLETGDPKTGPSTWILKAPAGCVVPWHSHTAEEQLIVVSGSVLAEMRSHPPAPLNAGSFAVMSGHMAHKFSCQGPKSCVMFVTFDRAYDIKWETGNP
jgi:quercetin dioxygenase-like cupin family protein